MRRLLLGIAILSTLFAGCSKHATEPPPALVTGPAPALLATQPPARSSAAPYDAEIWAQFDRPLDGRTVTAQTVFLKLDGQRLPDTVRYDGITRRVFLRPAAALQLQHTYTVEFSTSVKGIDGTPLPEGVFFQFTTNSLRRIAYDFPQPNALEGPVSALGWGGTTGPDGNVFFDVYVSDDSTAVARRAVASLQHSVFTRYLTSTPWPLGTRLFWAVSSENVATHERMDGEVQSFQTLDPATPIESVVITAQDYGSNDIRNATTQYCTNAVLPSGPGFNAGIHWNYTNLPPKARLASATFRLFFITILAGNFNGTRPSLWMAQNDWAACTMRAPGPPYNEPSGLLANAVSVDPSENDFTSTRLAALLEAQYRTRTLVYGTLLRTNSDIRFDSPVASDPARRPSIVVQFYRLP